jgi:hypothetical protein
MAGPDRRKIREWMIAESLRRRSAGVSDEALFSWMMGEGYDEIEALSMLAEALGWSGVGLRGQPFWPHLSPEQKIGLIKARRGGLAARTLSVRRVAGHERPGKKGRDPESDGTQD